MIGSQKLSTIRAEMRNAFKMSDAALFAWFDRQLGSLAQKPKANKAEMQTLRLLRDALVTEAEQPPTCRNRRRVAGAAKGK